MKEDNKTVQDEGSNTKEEKRVTVSVDTPVSKVLEYDKLGYKLVFALGDKFLVLGANEISALSFENKNKYFIAQGQRKLEKDKLRAKTLGLQIKPNLAQSTEILRVEGMDPNKHYRWKRPDELRQAGYDGYEIVDKDEVETFGGLPFIGKEGDPELVLVAAPKEVHEKHLRAIEELSQRKNRSVEADQRTKAKESQVEHFEDIETVPNKPFEEMKSHG